MRCRNIVLFLIAGGLLWAGPSPDPEAPYVPHELIVKLQPDASPVAAGTALTAGLGDRVTVLQVEPTLNYLVITFDPAVSLREAREDLLRDPAVRDVSYNYRARIHDTIPDDPYLHQQYALNNSGQEFYAYPEDEESYRGTSGADIKAFSAWDWYTGSADTIIAILDTGICAEHEDLEGKVVQGYNFIEDSFETSDDNGHGTFVASIAAASTHNGVGMAGVNWHAKLMPIKVADSDGYADYKSLALAIRYAADNGADILNISLGGPNPSFILEDALENALAKNVIIVASSGNTATNVDYPAAYDKYCLAVGASDENDRIAEYSNYGYSLDLVAPGDKVLGAFYDPRLPEILDGYALGSGTSYAAPLVAGTAGLVKAYKPFLTNSEIILLIKYTADDINAEYFPGVDLYAGYGRLNLYQLIGPYPVE